ncbi:LysM peptidoglycan-binding domain-containing protein [uncultured Serinicoccus sp.]|uniref:LysM peptidoglycan-binding domain-containing protein n=1 Tax=uncultured Serinicoccus sp. TaxID=735514 RepID=UPI00261C9873|nr:LysM peptidoglycan-binding domain-containing protein [uncultured Serinicoccus sp.]
MSTAIAHDILSPLPGPRPVADVAPRRPTHLRLVGEDDRRPSRAVRRRLRAGRLHLTRRGRLAVTATTGLVLAAVIWSMVGLLGPAGASTSVTVERGETLSQIASEQLPELPLSRAVTAIQRANSLSTTSIAAGQELVIPGR